MDNLNLKLNSAVMAIAAIVHNAQFANAADAAFGHRISIVTDDGDHPKNTFGFLTLAVES